MSGAEFAHSGVFSQQKPASLRQTLLRSPLRRVKSSVCRVINPIDDPTDPVGPLYQIYNDFRTIALPSESICENQLLLSLVFQPNRK